MHDFFYEVISKFLIAVEDRKEGNEGENCSKILRQVRDSQ